MLLALLGSPRPAGSAGSQRGGELGKEPSRGRARAPYGDGGGTCWCTQCTDSLDARLEDPETPSRPGRGAAVGRGPA